MSRHRAATVGQPLVWCRRLSRFNPRHRSAEASACLSYRRGGSSSRSYLRTFGLPPGWPLTCRTRFDLQQFRIVSDDPASHRLLGVARRSFEGSVASGPSGVEPEPPPRGHSLETRGLNGTVELSACIDELEFF